MFMMWALLCKSIAKGSQPSSGEAIPKLASISRSLRNERETSLYGDPETGLPPEELYFENDAREALDKADFVFTICRKLLEGA